MRNLTTSEIIGGLFIGAVLFLIFTKKNEEQLNDLQQNRITHIGVNNWKSLDYVQDFDEFNSRLTQSVKPIIQSSTQIVEQVPKEVEQISGNENNENNGTEYKNNETWKIMRDDNGDIAEISVSRDARVS
jgi:hypothetical protein